MEPNSVKVNFSKNLIENYITDIASKEQPYLVDDILKLVFSEDPKNYAALSLVSKKWRQLVTSPQLASKALSVCRHPLELKALSGTPKRQNLLGLPNRLITSLDTLKDLVLYKDNVEWDSKCTIENLSGTKKMEIQTGSQGNFLKVINNELYQVHEFRGLELYDFKSKRWEPLGDIPSRARCTLVCAADDKGIAYTREDADHIMLFDASTKKSIQIKINRSENNKFQYFQRIVFAGDKVIIEHQNPGKLEIYDRNGDLLDTLKKRSNSPTKIFGSRDELAVLWIGDNFSPSEITTYGFDTDNSNKLILKEKYSLKADQFTDGKLDDFQIQDLFIHNNKLYIKNHGTLRVFDSQGNQLTTNFNKITGAFATQGDLLAMGVQLPDTSYAVEIWNDDQKLCTLPTKGRVEKLILETGKKVQLTAGLADGSIEVWSPQIELDRDLKEMENEKKQLEELEASKSLRGILSNVSAAVWNFFGKKDKLK